MKERPILFSAPMVRAILEGRKTVTRRVLKPYRKHPIVNLAEAEPTLGYSGRHNDPDSWGYEFFDDGAPASLSACPELCPYGPPGDHLWLREAWRAPNSLDDLSPKKIGEACVNAGYRTPWCPIQYEADGARTSEKDWREFGPHLNTQTPGRYRHARFMPRWASRITLELTGVRVERLQDIGEAEAASEGIERSHGLWWIAANDGPSFGSAGPAFRYLWEKINGVGSWNANPWVWVVEFKRVEAQTA